MVLTGTLHQKLGLYNRKPGKNDMKLHRLVPFLLAATVPAVAQLHTFDPYESIATFAQSINASGAIAGNYQGPAYVHHGFVRDPQGTITSFDPAGSVETYAMSINADGAIAGYYLDANYIYHGFLRNPQGTITSFDPSGSVGTIAYGINASGAIVGYYLDTGNRSHGFVRSSLGSFTTFDPTGSTQTIAYGINSTGSITGWYYDATNVVQGFVRDPQGTITSFNPSGSLSTFAYGLNTNDFTAGYYYDTNSLTHGFNRGPQGTITSFDPPGSKGTFAYGVSGARTIAGYFLDATEVPHGFVRDTDGNIIPFDPPESQGTYAYTMNGGTVVAGYYNYGAKVHGMVGRVPNAIDISQHTGAVSDSVWQSAKQAGVSHAVVQAWDGGSQNSLAESQLAGAQSNGVATGASIRLSYFAEDSGAYQVGQAIQAIGSAITNLKFIALEVQVCCGEFKSWEPSTSYAKNALIMDPANHIQEVTTAGTSGPAAPAWNDAGGTTSDASVVWHDTGRVLVNEAARISKIAAAVSAIKAYNLPHGVVIMTDGPNGNWQTITGNCGTGSSDNCSDLIALPLWDVEPGEFYGGDGLLHCGDGIAGLVLFTPYSSTTWQTRSGNQYDWGIVDTSAGASKTCSGETDLFGLSSTSAFDLDYFDPALFQ